MVRASAPFRAVAMAVRTALTMTADGIDDLMSDGLHATGGKLMIDRTGNIISRVGSLDR